MTIIEPLPAERQTVLEPHQDYTDASTSGHHLAVVEDGMLMVTAELPDGRRQVLEFTLSGDALFASGAAEMSLGMRTVAVTRSLIRVTNVAQIGPAIREQSPLSGQMMQAICAHAQFAAEHRLVIGQLQARERLSFFLLDMAARQHGWISGGCLVELPMTREDIGDHLGMNKLTVTRLFGHFLRAGFIDLPGAHLAIIKNVAGLAWQTPVVPLKARGRIVGIS